VKFLTVFTKLFPYNKRKQGETMQDDEIEINDISSDPNAEEHLPVAGEIPEPDTQVTEDDLDI
jgi:hypothetical protein